MKVALLLTSLFLPLAIVSSCIGKCEVTYTSPGTSSNDLKSLCFDTTGSVVETFVVNPSGEYRKDYYHLPTQGDKDIFYKQCLDINAEGVDEFWTGDKATAFFNYGSCE